jgi:hypothetical protein
MKYQVTVICDSREEALAFLQAGFVGVTVAESAPAAGETEKPKRGRRAAATEPAAAAAAAPAVAPTAPPAVDASNILGLPAAAAAGDPLASLLNGTSAGQLPPVATPAPAPVAIPAAAPAAAALTQQDVIKAFVTLSQTPPPKGGIDVAKAIAAKLGVPTVTAIKPEQYADAVQLVRQALA